MTNITKLPSKTLRILISQADDTLAMSDFEASRFNPGVAQLRQRWGDGWRQQMVAERDRWAAELQARCGESS